QPHSKIRHRGRTHSRAPRPLSAVEKLAASHRVDFCALFRLLHVERGRNGTLALGALSHDFPWRVCLRRLEIRFILDSTGRRRESVALRGVKIRRNLVLFALSAILAGCATDTRHVLLIST